MIEYVKGTTRANSVAGDKTADIWGLGDVDPNYTADKQKYGFTVTATGDGTTDDFTVDGLATTDELLRVTVDGQQLVIGTDVSISAAETVTFTTAPDDGAKIVIAYLLGASDPATGEPSDLVTIPNNGGMPTLKAELKNIGLEAKARRISVYYSQMATFQAKTDYGFDLADGLAEQAVGQLSYEIDTEVVDMLYQAAPAADVADPSTGRPAIPNFEKTKPLGVNIFKLVA